ncbi:NFACT family protein [Helicobacter suis]|uniref:NFACT family protein n=1 Tax=Helicobacter suis TaxID=104628 RepID=UPI0013D76C60|nr:NFACT family protein [Helicobacter suis]
MIPYSLLYHFAQLLKAQAKITIRHAQNIFSLDTPAYAFKACMQKGNSYVYIDKTPLLIHKTALNLALEKHASNAKIVDVCLENEDRILKITLEGKETYKKTHTILQLEFTGKHSNAILLSSEGYVIEALHFVGLSSSYRPVLKNKPLAPLKKPPFSRPPLKPMALKELLQSLEELHANHSAKQLQTKKESLKRAWLKKKEALQSLLNQLKSPEELKKQATEKHNHACLILCHLHTLKPKDLYTDTLILEQEPIKLPKNARSFSDAADKLFKEAKKCQQKASHIGLQRENLLSKSTFLDSKIALLDKANLEELHMLTPPKSSKKSSNTWESLEIEGIRVGFGRNETENRALLKSARSRDIWAHIKDKPSAHMLIFSHPNNPSSSVLLKACKLLAKLTYPKLTSQQTLKVPIDYTQKKHVKFTNKSKAHVSYTHFSSVVIVLDHNGHDEGFKPLILD